MATSLVRLSVPIRRGGGLGGRLQRTFQVLAAHSNDAVRTSKQKSKKTNVHWSLSGQAPPCQYVSTNISDTVDDDSGDWQEFGAKIDDLFDHQNCIQKLMVS